MRAGGTGASGESLVFHFGGFESRVVFGRPQAGSVRAGSSRGASALVVADENLYRLHRGAVAGLATAEGGEPVTVPPGEESKSWESARRILQAAVERRLERDGAIVGIGGGMVCDLAAFCASLYMRGCELVLVPTSLLAMVDAALGGKTAVNFAGFKNLAGTFYPAGEIRVWIEALKTLPERELMAGLAEAIKTALLGDPELLALLEMRRRELLDREPEVLGEVVRRCLAVKGRIVEEDFRESGRRAILNLGHTFAHALEAVAGLGAWSHGETVAWGLARAARLGLLLGVTPPEHAERTRELLGAYGFQVGADAGVPPERLLAAMGADKKRRGGKPRLVLQRGIGDTVVQAVDEALILESLQDG